MRVRLSVRMAAVIAVLLTPMVLLTFHLAETQRQRELEHIRAQAMLTAKAPVLSGGRRHPRLAMAGECGIER